MTVNLEKMQEISLEKASPGLTHVICGLGWDVANTGFMSMFRPDFDLDASALCLNQEGKLLSTDEVIYFNHLKHHSEAIRHHGDNLTGEGEGDDEQITVELNKVPDYIYKIIFIVNIYEAVNRKQNFGQIKNAFMRLVNVVNGKEIIRYSLSGQGYQGMTGMVLADLHRQGDHWVMSAIGEGLKVKSLREIIGYYS